MADVEERYIYTNPLFQQYEVVWYRYIDDIFCIWWGGSETSIQEFVTFLNLPRIPKEVSFLDTMIKKGEGSHLEFDLYQKSTDRNRMLQYGSNHPITTKRLLPRSQFKRVERIVSDPNQLST